ncbi:LysM peptidoglycan-binding domain-containing protein [Desulfosporosinus sp. Sb-LF]|uniref:LysM peptidoglycan-binding domain-containing protein n=1 Tax=Desulfosporosinus sp. Sb-LF TaxID=2560027 RepID=UPI00107F009A|nr:LysM peptidoglycan-binding domain-containing protein [Desulfosporosinus sp. Sb-LF]TGE31681.1 LysM peptidoglycan-binding domain-containing protein [Desulfosporosinus sp. Sb-LF]
MTYIVQTGDTLYKIAQNFNTSINFILSTNPQITNPNLIYPGQIIVIPTGTDKCPLLRQGDRGSAVSRFQTLLLIARFDPGAIDGILGPRTQAALVAFQESQKELERTGVADEETWVALDAECEPRVEITSYTVRPGDSLFIISTRFNVSIQSILMINPEITNPNVISAGQIIRIPAS